MQLLAESDICQLTEGIWNSMLGLEVERVPESVTLEDGYFSGTIRVDGAWEGEVALDCSSELARSLTAIMFGGEPETMEPEEIRDAVGELTNMLGGNIKALLPGPSHLSLPTVTESHKGVDHSLRLEEGEATTEVGFFCEGGPLRVTVMKKTAAPEAVAAPALAAVMAGSIASSSASRPADTVSSLEQVAALLGGTGGHRGHEDQADEQPGEAKPTGPSIVTESVSTVDRCEVDLADVQPLIGSSDTRTMPQMSTFVQQPGEGAAIISEEIQSLGRFAQEGKQILEEAKQEAGSILAAAHAEAARLVESSEIRCLASGQAVKILADAERDAAEIRDGARKYAEELLTSLERYGLQFIGSVRKSQEWLQTV